MKHALLMETSGTPRIFSLICFIMTNTTNYSMMFPSHDTISILLDIGTILEGMSVD